MPASSFDFDVITGPSTPREARAETAAHRTPPASPQPAPPRTR